MAQTPVKELTKKFHHNKILETCKHLFYNKNLQQVSSDEIAAAAGYSKRTIYVYFSSKEDIFRQIQTQCLNEFASLLAQAPLTCLMDFLQCVRSYANARPEDFYYVAKRTFSKRNEADYFLFAELLKPLIRLVSDTYDYAQPSIDAPLLIWNALLCALENDIPLSRLNDLLLHGLCGGNEIK